MKKLRTLIRRPSALPAMVELSKPSWVLLSGSTAGQPKSLCDAKSAAGKSYKQVSDGNGHSTSNCITMQKVAVKKVTLISLFTSVPLLLFQLLVMALLN